MILIFWFFISALVGGMIGQGRGCPGFGVLLGLLLGPLGWLLTLLNDKRTPCPECLRPCPTGARRCQCGAQFTVPIGYVANVNEKICPYCARPCGNEFNCRKCGKALPRPAKSFNGEDDVERWARENNVQ